MSALTRLLEQATPGPWTYEMGALRRDHFSVLRLAIFDSWPERQADKEVNGTLAALAPDMARLLIDMAALVVDQGKFIDFDVTPNLSQRYGALLARFAELEQRAAP